MSFLYLVTTSKVDTQYLFADWVGGWMDRWTGEWIGRWMEQVKRGESIPIWGKN